MNENKGYIAVHMDEVPAVQSTCGTSRRAFLAPDNQAASVHMLELRADPQPHYHRNGTEIYYILEGEGSLELNGQDVPVRPGSAVLIQPGTFHRGKGRMRLLVICVPPYDKSDEFFE
jgi:mannose-6-phosphate isomerase-like protein (cupin superfamily)